MKAMRIFEDGLSLIETIVAIGVLVVGISGGILLTNNSINTMTFSRHLFEGNQFAAEGVEIVRSVRDSNWLKNTAWDAGLSAGVYRIEFDSILNTMKLVPLSSSDAFDTAHCRKKHLFSIIQMRIVHTLLKMKHLGYPKQFFIGKLKLQM